jgi:hypothetical protein
MKAMSNEYVLIHSVESIRKKFSKKVDNSRKDNIQHIINHIVENINSNGSFYTMSPDWFDNAGGFEEAISFLEKSGFKVVRDGEETTVTV